MAITYLTRDQTADIDALLGPAEALEATCRHGAKMIAVACHAGPVSRAIRDDAGSLPALVAMARNARTRESARKHVDLLLDRA